MDFKTLIIWLQTYSIIPVMLIFLLLVVTTYWPGRRSSFDRQGSIPLNDDR